MTGVVALGSDRVALTVDVGFGARVLTLTDRMAGRQWLLEGRETCDAGEDAAYLGEAACGWDECFPTVLTCDHSAWGGRLRDHGMMWGRAWDVVDAGPGHLEARYQADGISFVRRLSVEGAVVIADYAVTSSREAPVPYLWSQHAVLAVGPDDRIRLAGQGPMAGGNVGFDWPRHPTRDLSRVGPRDEGFALKSYGLTRGQASAVVSGLTGGLRFDWRGPEVPALGVWLNYGGWPDGGPPVHHIALEPTTGAADDLAAAEGMGQARWLRPAETHRWSVRLTLVDPEPGHAP